MILDQVGLSSPVLNEGELEALLKDPILKPQVLPTFFDIRKGVEGSLERTLNRLCEAADEAVRNGSQLLVLSDRADELVSTFPPPPTSNNVCVVMLHAINYLHFQGNMINSELIEFVLNSNCIFPGANSSCSSNSSCCWGYPSASY